MALNEIVKEKLNELNDDIHNYSYEELTIKTAEIILNHQDHKDVVIKKGQCFLVNGDGADNYDYPKEILNYEVFFVEVTLPDNQKIAIDLNITSDISGDLEGNCDLIYPVSDDVQVFPLSVEDIDFNCYAFDFHSGKSITQDTFNNLLFGNKDTINEFALKQFKEEPKTFTVEDFAKENDYQLDINQNNNQKNKLK